MPTSTSQNNHVTVIGAGAWGTALACCAHRAGNTVTLWARRSEQVNAMQSSGQNQRYLPDITLPESLNITYDMAMAVQNTSLILLVVPSVHLRATCAQLAGYIAPHTPLLICAKGVEDKTHKLMSTIASEEITNCPIGVLSGPNFAHEIALGLPAATTLAMADETLGKQLSHMLSHATFRPYWSDDVIGAEIAGAVKNVIAIACGIIQGRQMGDNAKATLITRGLAEMNRLSIAVGGKAETMMGLSGIGDLILTCGAMQSRNMSLGYALGQGETLESILQSRNGVTEGVKNAQTIMDLANHLNIEMPIVSAVNDTLHNGVSIDNAIKNLLSRPLKSEKR